MIRAWRVKYQEPDPREVVSVQFVRTEGEAAPRLYPPWVMEIEEARAIFGNVVDGLSDKAREIKLTMEIVRFADE